MVLPKLVRFGCRVAGLLAALLLVLLGLAPRVHAIGPSLVPEPSPVYAGPADDAAPVVLVFLAPHRAHGPPAVGAVVFVPGPARRAVGFVTCNARRSAWASLYAYCDGDPVNRIDPSGLRAIVHNEHKESFHRWLRQNAPHWSANAPTALQYGWPAKDEGASRWLFLQNPNQASSNFQELYLTDAGTDLDLDAMGPGDMAFAAMLFDQDTVYVWDGSGWRNKSSDDEASWIVKMDRGAESFDRAIGNGLSTLGEWADAFDRNVVLPLQHNVNGLHRAAGAAAGVARLGPRAVALLRGLKTVENTGGGLSRFASAMGRVAQRSRAGASWFLDRSGTFLTEFNRGLSSTLGSSGANAFQAAFDAAKKAFGAARAFPHGFKTAEEFAEFGQKLRTGLARSGANDVQPLFQGSSVTGQKFTTGEAFDAGRLSDFDIALASPVLLAKARQLGIGLRSGGMRTGPLTAADLEKLGLSQVADELSRLASRPVNFMIFGDAAEAAARAPSIPVP